MNDDRNKFIDTFEQLPIRLDGPDCAYCDGGSPGAIMSTMGIAAGHVQCLADAYDERTLIREGPTLATKLIDRCNRLVGIGGKIITVEHVGPSPIQAAVGPYLRKKKLEEIDQIARERSLPEIDEDMAPLAPTISTGFALEDGDGTPIGTAMPKVTPDQLVKAFGLTIAQQGAELEALAETLSISPCTNEMLDEFTYRYEDRDVTKAEFERLVGEQLDGYKTATREEGHKGYRTDTGAFIGDMLLANMPTADVERFMQKVLPDTGYLILKEGEAPPVFPVPPEQTEAFIKAFKALPPSEINSLNKCKHFTPQFIKTVTLPEEHRPQDREVTAVLAWDALEQYAQHDFKRWKNAQRELPRCSVHTHLRWESVHDLRDGKVCSLWWVCEG